MENGIVMTEDDGTILKIFEAKDVVSEIKNIPVEIFHGILVPGFVNTHCHLELSFMKGQLQEHTGLTGFIREFVSKRGEADEREKQKAIHDADQEMYNNGIVAVGDISNEADTFRQKAISKLYYHTFIEAFDLHPSRTDESFFKAMNLLKQLKIISSESSTSICAHAPYSVTPALFARLNAYAKENKSMLSIHNQESVSENEMFKFGTGNLIEMYAAMGLDFSWFNPPGQNSIASILKLYSGNAPLLLVHNTYTSEADIRLAEEMNPIAANTNSEEGKRKIYWATCPNANLFIENKLPDYRAFIKHNVCMTIGTDSLASNHELSILEEMKTIAVHEQSIPFETLLKWATINGAEFLGIDQRYGTLEKGKKPGLVLIERMNGLKFTSESFSRRII